MLDWTVCLAHDQDCSGRVEVLGGTPVGQFMIVAMSRECEDEKFVPAGAHASTLRAGVSCGRVPLSRDFQSAESRYKLEPADVLRPERLYHRRWALTLLDQVVTRLQSEFAEAGKLGLFERLKEFLTGKQDSPPCRQVAGELAMTEGAVKVAVHRLRRRYRELLREEIAQTVASRDEIDDELRQLFAAVGSAKHS